MKISFSLLLFLILSTSLFSGEYKVKVVDSLSNEAIASASVHLIYPKDRLRDSTVFLLTDSKGYFEVKSPKKAKLVVSHVGYHTKILSIENGKPSTIHLSQKVYMLDEVVSTGQFTPKSIQKSVYSINVIGSQKIQAQAATNLRDLMTNASNVRLSQDQILGSSMSINGVSGQNIKILVDGVPVIGRMNGNIDLSQLNLNNAAKIEIIEGPMSSIYGSDALGGVVNIITKDPECDRFEIKSNNYYESTGVYNFDASADFVYGLNKFRVSGGRNFFSGWSANDTSRHKEWIPREQVFADLQFSRSYKWFRFKYVSRYFQDFLWNKGALRAPYYETAIDDKFKTLRFTNTLFTNMKIGNDHFLDVNTSISSYERRKNQYFKDMVTLNEKLSASADVHDTTSFYSYLLRATFSNDDLYSDYSYQTGIDFNYETGEGKRLKNNTQNIGDYAGFMSFQYKPYAGMIIQPSIRYIYNTEFNAPIIPSFHFKADLIDNLSFRTSFARGFRAPSLKELFLYFVDSNHNIIGNENLDAETANSFNAAFLYMIPSATDIIKIEAKSYYNNIKDKIELANIKNTNWTYTNIDEFTSYGANLSLEYFHTSLSSKVSFGYTGRKNSFRDQEWEKQNKFTYSPELQANIIYKIPYIDTQISLFYKHTGKYPEVQISENADGIEELVEVSVNSYNTMDLSLARTFLDEFLDIRAGVKNIFDITDIKRSRESASQSGGHNASSSQVPIAWGRSFFVELKLKYK